MRLLAAADAYQAMTEARAYRPALQPAAAAAQLREEVRLGRQIGVSTRAAVVLYALQHDLG